MLKQVTVFHEAGRYAGWPANYGMWAWGDEIVLVFTVGYMQTDAGYHARDRSRPFTTMQARSLDGGETWSYAPMPCDTPGNRALSADEHVIEALRIAPHVNGPINPLRQLDHPIDLTQPDLAIMCARTGLRDEALSWFHVSTDRCHSWSGPYALPALGQPSMKTRTDILISDRSHCLLMLTVNKADGREGRVLCAASDDGLQTITFRSWISPEPEGYQIMPASVRLGDGSVLTAVRRSDQRQPRAHCWIDLHRSQDDGVTWRHIGRPAPDTGYGGNPPTLTTLPDGRLCLVYGFRAPPYQMHVRLSDDQGQSWSEPIILRSGAGNHDLGYPRTVLRADGCLVSAYYWNDDADGERSIQATIWRP